MRKIIVAEHISLDGVIQGPGGPTEDSSDGFRLGGWSATYDDDAIGQAIQNQFSQPFDLLLGRRTYDIWATYWPFIKTDSPAYGIAKVFNDTAKHVATHTPDTLKWQNSHALKGDVANAVSALKKQAGANLLTWGSSELVRQLLASGLVDELQLIIYPVVLGRGKRLFGDNVQPSAFTLTKSIVGTSGVVFAQYARGGEVRTGTFGG